MIFPYLNFTDGKCQEGIDLYTRAFGEMKGHIRRYKELAPDPSMEDYVMHAEMELGDLGYISMADATWPIDTGSAVNIIIRTTEEKMRSGWSVLAEEGTVVMDLAPFEPEGGELMGTITDKFGFTWTFTQNQ